MNIFSRIRGKESNKISGEVFEPVMGELVTPEGTVTQYFDPATQEIYHTEYSGPRIQSAANTRGLGTDLTMVGGRVVEIHPRFQRIEDNPLNPPPPKTPKQLPRR